MAGNKINTKKKDDRTKINRATGQDVEENEGDVDFSLLRKPIHTSVTGFAQAIKIFDQVTEELKSLLTNECDLLYECKVCRNIFRSLANFISHKRIYCKENFNSSVHSCFMKEPCTIQEVLKIRKLEENYQESLNETKCQNSLDENENDERIPMSKDITEVLEKIVKSRGVKEKQIEDQQLEFQKIPMSSVAVFQNINHDNNSNSDNMRTQVNELDQILSRENAVLQNDGTLKMQSNTSTDHIIQISDDDENENTGALKCKTCDLQFSTLKTLKFHMKYKHVENRLVYPCPDCADVFSTSWSVFRHLFKVHRKTAAQIRRLRESIQAKAFRMNNPPAFYERRRAVPKVTPQKITEEERLDQENQAWLEELDGESEGRRCCGCGRTFERRAALVAHSNTCSRRHPRRIGIQIRKDYHKEQRNPYLSRVYEPKPVVEETPPETKTIKKENNEETIQVDEEMPVIEEQKDEEENKEITETNVEDKPFLFDSILMNNLPFAQQAEKSNLTAFKQKILPDIEREQLMCKKCNTKHNELTDLLCHMASHYKWIRYACKLCNFKDFNFEKLPEHVKIVHKLKGDSDFYHSTVKAVDGVEAMELAETVEESNDIIEVSPDSRRPSRCSSDSSRLSDDSSCSNKRLEAGSRKRKANKYTSNAKKKRDMYITEVTECQKVDETQKEKDAILSENDTSSNSKLFEENLSDLDEVDERILKRQTVEKSTVASRRPVRKKSKPKNEDFEYDLSNLLKLEAQSTKGYRDSQIVTTKPTQTKKKSLLDLQQNYEAFNKDCCGALVTLSWKSAGKAQSHMKTLGVFTTKERISTTFVRPMVPKVSRIDKISPKKDENETKDEETASPIKVELCNLTSPHKNVSKNNENDDLEQKSDETTETQVSKVKEDATTINDTENESVTNESNKTNEESKTTEADKIKSLEIPKPNLNVPILPIKLRRQSLDVMKNPLIKKNITDFTKVGMKTKILVIKPINRNNDGPNSINTPLKFQTIKLKDPTKASSNEERKDQVVVVKVPNVESAVNKSIINNSINTNTENKNAASDKDASAKDANAKDASDKRPSTKDASDKDATDTDASDKDASAKDASDKDATDTDASDNYVGLSKVKEIVPENENSGEQICDSKLTNTIKEIPIVSQNTVNLGLD